MGNSDSKDRRVLKSFEEALDKHGYGFHYAVLKKTIDLHDADPKRYAFFFEASEFPVGAGGNNTKIDFVLHHSSLLRYSDSAPIWSRMFLLAECKRANPALSNWCFIRAPFTRRTVYANPLVLEAGTVNSMHRPVMRNIQNPISTTEIFHIALPIKSDQKGDSSGEGRDVIEQAATQSMRGLNGFVNFIRHSPEVIGAGNRFILLPIIFTTAELWGSDADLKRADLESGKLDISTGGSFRSYEWLFLEYNQSPTLKHTAEYADRPASLRDSLEQDYVRTIAVVSAKGIESFMEWASNLHLVLIA
jgi:hypothetical protein